MIVFRITMNVIPEKQLEMMQTLISMIELTAKEAGCHELWRFLRYRR
jgi:quinol monooxygenase YgiN